MPLVNNMLFPLFTALLPFPSVWAHPTEPSVLSIPVHDIVNNDFSAHEAHPNFKLYSLWLDSPVGSYVGRDPKAAFTKHANVVAIDCHSHIGECLFTSRLSFADITHSKSDLDNLNSMLEERLQARNEEKPAALSTRALDEHSSLEKRAGNANTLYSSTHLKTYPAIEGAGFQHFIAWNLKICRLTSKLD